ncbi:MAG: GAF domain-containing protein [bacterium]|nr:GAF domain-containing protein [bacterium]
MPDNDMERLDTLESENRKLRRSVEELSVLNDLAGAIGGAHDLEAVMQTIVHRSMRVVQAQQGVITLVRSDSADPLKTLVRTMTGLEQQENLHIDAGLLGWMLRYRSPLLLNDPHNDDRFRHTRWDASVRSVLCVPMMVQSKLVGILTASNKKEMQNFSKEDARLLSIIAAQSAQVVENARLYEERAEILQVFGRHTAPEVVEALLQTGPELSSRKQHVCVMFFDIRGFTGFSEQRSPEEVVDYLNKIFNRTIAIVNRHHGIIHQLLGDGFMALFGAPLSHGNDCGNAVNAASAIVESLKEACAEGLLPPTKSGIGLHAGEVVAGLVGSDIHKEYKVTGDVVNLASRIEQITKRYDTPVLISEEVWNCLDEPLPPAEFLSAVTVRGREEPVRLYRPTPT